MKLQQANSKFLERKWVIVAFANFGIAALMGLLLRSAALVDMPWLNFRHMTHAHSHAAMMGWLYMAIFALLMHFFLSEEEQKKKKYQRTFVALQIAVIGMMASFPIQGYAAISISFSALHLFSSYTFLTFIWRNAKSENHQPIILLKTAIILMMFSTLGVYALGPVTAKIGRLTDAYNLCIQFFLHFQFQGWFVFAIAALLMQQLSKVGIGMKALQFRAFHLLLVIAALGMVALPTSQYLRVPELLALNTIGSFSQMAAFSLLFGFLFPFRKTFRNQPKWVRICAWMALASVLLKAIGQAALSWPEMSLVPLNIRPMVIGFIHLLMLGMITSYLLMVLLQSKIFDVSKRAFQSGVLFLFLGIVVTELLLFAQGVSIWTGFGVWSLYNEALFAGSIFLVIGVFGLLVAIISNRKSEETQMKLRLLPLPLVLISITTGIVGGWMRLGWQIPLPEASFQHGILMTGGFLGTLITLERTVSMPSNWWRLFPAVAGLSSILLILGERQFALMALMVGNAGLLAVYIIQMAKHKDAYWNLLLAGGTCWLLGNIVLMKVGLVAAATTWWIGFIFLTIVGERLELTRYLNVPKWAKTVLWIFAVLLVIGIALPFHSVYGRQLMGVASIGTALWLMKYDMARISIRKEGFHRYVATGLLVGYGWLLINGLTVFLIPNHPLFYDLFLHTFFLGFAFSMIWAHAPIIFPAILKTTHRPYHPILWAIWGLFQLTLIGRTVFTWAENATVMKLLGGANGIAILLMFFVMAFILVHQLRKYELQIPPPNP